MAKQDAVDLRVLSDLATPWCLRVVATLRIADHIAAGVDRIEDLGQVSRVDPDSLHRVLRHLIGKRVFEELTPG